MLVCIFVFVGFYYFVCVFNADAIKFGTHLVYECVCVCLVIVEPCVWASGRFHANEFSVSDWLQLEIIIYVFNRSVVNENILPMSNKTKLIRIANSLFDTVT